jgi:hypothetical protein
VALPSQPPCYLIVRQVLSENNFPFIQESNKESVCDACQKGKSHQLPYPRSTSVSSGPLDLIFSDVSGPAPTSVGRNNFYVSFIDDYSKFTWVYLLRHKTEVFSDSMISSSLLNACLIARPRPCKLTGEASTKN